MFPHRSRVLAVAVLAAIGLLAAACGDGGATADSAPDALPMEPAPLPAEPAPATAAEPAPGDAPEPADAGTAEEEPDAAPASPPPDAPAAETSPETGTTPAEPPAAEDPTDPDAAGDAAPPAGTEADDDLEGAGSGTEAPAGPEPEPEGTASGGSGFPVTIASDAGEWVLEAAPQRIVSMSPAATEILFAIGAGPQVVAVDEWSTFPPEAPVTGLSGFDPNVEAVIAYEPDLVVVAYDANDLVAGLRALDVPVIMQAGPLDIEGGYAAVEELALAAGRAAEAGEVIATMRAEIAAAVATAPGAAVRIYHEIDQTYYSASSHSFIGAVYGALGADNIADPADADGYGYPQLTEEYIIEADPELIVISDLVGYTAADVAARPGWETISAVRDGNILMVDADVASRWGPRLPQFVRAVAEALAAIAAPASESAE